MSHDIPAITPPPQESESEPTQVFEFQRVRKVIEDIISQTEGADLNEDGRNQLRDEQTDALLEEMAERDPKLLGEVLFDLTCSGDETLGEIAADNIAFLYKAAPDIARPLWGLMAMTDSTSYDAISVLHEYDWEETDPRKIADYAVIERLGDRHFQMKHGRSL